MIKRGPAFKANEIIRRNKLVFICINLIASGGHR